MGFLDKAKGLAGKAQEAAAEHADQVKSGIEKAEGLADKATKGKFSKHLDTASDKATGYVDKLKDDKS